MDAITLGDLQLPLAGELAVAAAMTNWTAQGFQVVRSFEIDGACASFSHNTCPHTGKSPCECLLAVLFVSDAGRRPVTIIAHGHDDATTFSVQDPGPAQSARLLQAVWQALETLAH